ncbi:unnamed protein product [Rangifer tarandus platyrhynchus]|uniref:Uncharacterized protein n=1 Tax=Rangifer tarandus platyrhynchus TaxID=3082113 RepID=A0AC59YP80_RANTA
MPLRPSHQCPGLGHTGPPWGTGLLGLGEARNECSCCQAGEDLEEEPVPPARVKTVGGVPRPAYCDPLATLSPSVKVASACSLKMSTFYCMYVMLRRIQP